MTISLNFGMGLGEDSQSPPGGGGGSYTGPLDIQSGAIVAYSQRAMGSTTRGTALYTLRRSSDNTTQSFSSDVTTGDPPTAEMSTFIGGGSGFVSLWNDQANGNNAIQTIDGQQPQWLSSAIGGKPGFSFTHTRGDWLGTAGSVSVFSSNAMTVFAVALCSSTGITSFQMPIAGQNFSQIAGPNGPDWAFGFLQDVNPPNNIAVREVTDDTGFNNGAGYVTDFGQAAFDAVSLIYSRVTPSTNTIYINGTQITAITNREYGSGMTGTNSWQLGVGCDDVAQALAGPPESLNGQIVELLIYDANLGDAVALSLQQNIAAYYGITL